MANISWFRTISDTRFNDILDDLAKTYDLSHITPKCVTQEAIITFEVTKQLLDDCSDIDRFFNDDLLTFIDHTRGRLRREHKIDFIFPKMFSWLLPYFDS